MASFRRLSRRIVFGARAINQGFENFSTDMRLLFRRPKDRIVLRQKRLNGFQMIVRAEEVVGHQLYYKGIFESEETKFLKSRVNESSVCFDIGANIGYYSLLFASLCPQGYVHCFEPIPLNYHILCANSMLNVFANLRANLCAIGDKEGSVEFVVSRDSGFSSLMDTGRIPAADKIVVQMNTLDLYCSTHNIKKIDILKVDVEGAEGRVLCGAQRVMSDPELRPHTVMLELHQAMLGRYGSSREGICAKLQSIGYKPFVLVHGSLVPFQPEVHAQLENVIFSHD